MRNWTLWFGPIAAAAVGVFAKSQGLSAEAAWTAAVAVLCSVWWVAQPVPIPVTSLVPIAVFPLVGVLSAAQVGQAYGDPMVLLFLGGFILSMAMESSGAHRRLAIGMIRLCAAGPKSLVTKAAEGEAAPAIGSRRLVMGFMLATGVVSMWISNSATTLMMLPIAMAALEGATDKRLRTAVLLSIAYGSSIGGIATPVGSPPNLICMQAIGEATGREPSFAQWMSFGLPISLVMLPIAALWLARGLKGPAATDLPYPGPWRAAEWRTLAVFVVTAVLWITRNEPFGGWSKALGLEGANDASVALLATIALFVIPSGEPAVHGKPAPRLLDWQQAAKIPWGMLLLFSGGMTLAEAFTTSGLSEALGDQLHGLAALPAPLLVGSICLMAVFFSEIASNTATTAMLMPIMAAMALAAGVEPTLLMLPAAVGASFGFMLPVATPPNGAVYGAGVEASDMAREGLALNLLGVVIVTAVTLFLLR